MRWIVFFLFVVSSSLCLIGLSMDLIFHTSYTPKIEEWQATRSQQLPNYLADKTYFATHAFFSHNQDRSKDFSSFLASRIPANKKNIFVSPVMQKEVLGLGEDWLDRRYRLKTPRPVIELFHRALEYTYWDIEKSLSMNKHLSATEFVIAGQLLMAHAIDSQSNISEEVLQKVRHFARLLLSCEDFNFKLAALSLLIKEKEMSQYLQNRKPAKAVPWGNISHSDINRYRTYLYRTYSYMGFLTPTGIFQKVFNDEQPPVGFCAIYKLRAPVLARAANSLFSQFPFEPEYKKEYQSYVELQKIAKERCLSPSQTTQIDQKFVSQIPFYRRIIALRHLLNHKSLAEGL